MRADARRNRARILEAAEAVFAAKGVIASTEEVARAAGVGVGTVFRHFPAKEDLVEAVLLARLEALAAKAEALMDADAGPAFFTFFRHVVEQSAAKNAYADMLERAGRDINDVVGPIGPQLHGALGALLERAQKAEAVRPDVGPAELIALLLAAVRAIEHATGDPALQAHTTEIILDGLRPQQNRDR